MNAEKKSGEFPVVFLMLSTYTCIFSTQKVAAYEGILQAAKGSANEKKLAAGFITR